MRSFLSVLLLVAAVALTVWVTISQLPGEAAAAGPAATAAARVQQIRSIAIDGRDLPVAALREAMHTEVGGYVDDASLAADRRALLEVLAERGYLAAAVSPPTVTFDASGAYVVIAIDRGPQYKLRTVTIVAPEKARHVVTLASGDVASLVRLERVRQSLVESLPQHTVSLTTRLDPATASMDVDLIVTPAAVSAAR